MNTTRNAEDTRRHILHVTAAEINEKGFKATSLADILERSSVSKGALYHHFSNKLTLGYAVFDEVFACEFSNLCNIPIGVDSPLEAMSEWVTEFAESITAEEVRLGCPVCNIATEMANADQGFKERTDSLFARLENNLANAIMISQQRGQARLALEPTVEAKFIIACFQGIAVQGKYSQDVSVFRSSLGCLSRYLLSLTA